jgi:hypothetical protein|tara:strand:- start:14279 stop:14743 length:465 start_codon:yes stop_codon:yes gene_type:complete
MKRIEDNIHASELEVVEFLQKKWGVQIQYTGLNVFEKIDAYIFKDSSLKGIAEIKVRRQGYSWMKDYGSVVMSFQKIQIGADLSRLLGVKFMAVTYTSDNKIITFQITDEKGNIVCPMNIRNVEMKKDNINKSLVNAYLNLEDNKYCNVYHRGF